MIRNPHVGESVEILPRNQSITTRQGGAVVGEFIFSRCHTGKILNVWRQPSGKLSFIEVVVDHPNYGVFTFYANELRRRQEKLL